MSSDIPEYYRHFLEPSSPPDPPPQQPVRPGRDAPGTQPFALPDAAANAALYQADTFVLAVPEPWRDETIYAFAGSLEDDFRHTLTIVVDRDVPVDSLVDYVDWQLMTLATVLKGHQVLKRDPVTLDNGMPAYRVICRWSPVEQRSVYQEQLYLLHEQTGYKLTATFTRKTRRTLGPRVERMMLGFDPVR